MAAAKGTSEPIETMWDEAKDHVFPWDHRFSQRARGIQALMLGFTFLVTLVWILGLLGHLRPVVVIRWWMAWSVFELVVRVNCKPWFREGPLWRRLHRPARNGELAFYVLTKNVLIGGLLFLLMSFLTGTHP